MNLFDKVPVIITFAEFVSRVAQGHFNSGTDVQVPEISIRGGILRLNWEIYASVLELTFDARPEGRLKR